MNENETSDESMAVQELSIPQPLLAQQTLAILVIFLYTCLSLLPQREPRFHR